MIRWLYKHYALTAIVSVYYLALVGWGTYKVFSDLAEVTAAVGGVYLTLMGLPAIISGMIKWRLEKDNGDSE